MTLRELIATIEEQGGTMDTEVFVYVASEVYEPQVLVSAEDSRAYILEK